MTRKKRPIKARDLRLWQKVTESVTPIDNKSTQLQALIDQLEKGEADKPPIAPHSKRAETQQKIVAADLDALREAGLGGQAAGKAKPAPPPAEGLDRKEKKRILQGRLTIEARLDLHGMTQKQAHDALFGFLRNAQARGLKHVLVITGKGNRESKDPFGFESERGILRRVVPKWLSEPEIRALIVGFEEAHRSLGGAGALHIRLRSRNKLRK